MEEIRTFDNQEFGEMRVVKRDDGEPLFIANDICSFFGVTNRNRVLQQLDDDEKGVRKSTPPVGGRR